MNQIISTVRVFEHNGQHVTTSHEIARLTGIPHSDVLKSIYVQKQYYEQLSRAHVFERDFMKSTEAGIKGTSSLNSNPRKRGRPSIIYLLTKEGAFSFIGGLRGVKACEFRLAIAEAFVVIEQALKQSIEEIAALRAENAQLREKPKTLPGSRTGQISAPVLTANLWGEDEIVGWELRPKDTLDEYMLTLANLRHCNRVAEGLQEKKRELTDKLVNEELSRRVAVTDLTERRFKLIKTKK